MSRWKKLTEAVLRPIPVLVPLVLVPLVSPLAETPARVLYLPFEDEVQLSEAWDLAVDLPRWYSETVDTIGDDPDSVLLSVEHERAMALLAENRLNRDEFLSPDRMVKLAAVFDAVFVVTGKVTEFKVRKRSISADGELGGSHAIGNVAVGKGGASVMGSLKSFSATVRMTVDIYNGLTGTKEETLTFDSDAREGGLDVWLPFHGENDEIIFHYLSRTPFGSEYFHKSVIGAVMKSFSLRLHNRLVALRGKRDGPLPSVLPQSAAKSYIKGKVLERTAQDVYLNLGSADNLLLGERFEVMYPSRPVVEAGDTLGWVEERAALVEIREIKSTHFSQATIVEETVPVKRGWTVRKMIKEIGP